MPSSNMLCPCLFPLASTGGHLPRMRPRNAKPYQTRISETAPWSSTDELLDPAESFTTCVFYRTRSFLFCNHASAASYLMSSWLHKYYPDNQCPPNPSLVSEQVHQVTLVVQPDKATTHTTHNVVCGLHISFLLCLSTHLRIHLHTCTLLFIVLSSFLSHSLCRNKHTHSLAFSHTYPYNTLCF